MARRRGFLIGIDGKRYRRGELMIVLKYEEFEIDRD